MIKVAISDNNFLVKSKKIQTGVYFGYDYYPVIITNKTIEDIENLKILLARYLENTVQDVEFQHEDFFKRNNIQYECAGIFEKKRECVLFDTGKTEKFLNMNDYTESSYFEYNDGEVNKTIEFDNYTEYEISDNTVCIGINYMSSIRKTSQDGVYLMEIDKGSDYISKAKCVSMNEIKFELGKLVRNKIVIDIILLEIENSIFE